MAFAPDCVRWEYIETIVVTSSDDGYTCRSATWGITARSRDEAEALTFVKRTVLAVIGMSRNIPDELKVRFEVDRQYALRDM